MLSKLHFLFLPDEKNNQKAKALHLSSLVIFLFLIVSFQSALSLVSRLKPGVLGFASNIDYNGLLEFTNKQRIEKGLAPLKTNDLLIEAAQQKASSMFLFNCWSHNCNDKTPWWFIKNVGYQYLYAGENLARDFGDSQSVVNAWMNSPTHRDNILNGKYEEVGFAIVDGILNDEETTLVVQMFGSSGGTPSIASGKKEISALLPQVMAAEQKKKVARPIISSFVLTKAFSLILVGFLIILLFFDAFLVYYRKTARVSGKSFIHLSFFTIILISILLYYQGQIL